VGVVVLAAGASRRLPGPKQLLRYRGATLLRRAAQTAVGPRCGPVVVVLGCEAGKLRFELTDLDVRVAENDRWADGMSTSLRAGLDALEALGPIDAALLTTCDQPLVTSDHLRQLVLAYVATRPPAVASEYAGTVGVPALFDRSLFAELMQLEGDQGAKRVLERHLPNVTPVSFEDAALDIDTPEDLSRLSDRG
jgi:molybdenum cofactor cytidylyltransferase